MAHDAGFRYETAGGLIVDRWTEAVDPHQPIERLIDALDTRRGALLTSTFEFPGRYTRWDIGFVDPALEVRAQGRNVEIEGFGQRGYVMLSAINTIAESLQDEGALNSFEVSDCLTRMSVNMPTQRFTEEERSRQPTVFSILRKLIQLFRSDSDRALGLYGAFGYDLAFQFDAVTPHHPRSGDQRDLVLFVPDEIVVVDHVREEALRHRYDFTWLGRSTLGNPWPPGEDRPFETRPDVSRSSDHEPGEFARIVERAKEYFAKGDLFEVTPSQVFSEGTSVAPSEIFRRLRARNPAPYGALINLGRDEFLIAASPEMYVRVEGSQVETCPIAGTIARGDDALSDADQIKTLLMSSKDESELTMCTDVDRNDKSRVCDPASIKVLGRRQIEMYSRLFHTVDHVTGTLLPRYDGLDAFLTHMWAVTVTGAPKLWAMRFIEEHEASPRAWYGGAIGALCFNGNINTGLTLRTIHVKDGVASVRAGATLLMDSEPESEETETHTKAAALLDAIHNSESSLQRDAQRTTRVGENKRILFVDHEDSFVHTLAGYFRRTGADVTTIRVALGEKLDAMEVDAMAPDLLVLSPGPGRPIDFNVVDSVAIACDRGIPVFGVCLGLQGIVEHFGGELDQLAYPAHGKSSEVLIKGGRIFEGLPERFGVGRYHSLHGRRSSLPPDLVVTAETEDGLVMGIEHRALPIAGVQFHPESIMTLSDENGFRIIENVLTRLIATNR